MRAPQRGGVLAPPRTASRPRSSTVCCTAAEAAGRAPRVVDISADFRYATAAAYEAVYQHAHGAPRAWRNSPARCPSTWPQLATPHVAHPGCFATAMLLASVPLLAKGLVTPTLFVSGVTGSTGSGRKPVEGTHHPLRHSDLYSYSALAHRHVPEVAACALAASGVEARFRVRAALRPFRPRHPRHGAGAAAARRSIPTQLLACVARFLCGRAVRARRERDAPRVKNVVASNYAHLSAVATGRTVAVMCALDNLTKGAAGGAVQWMNRLFDLPETCGLTAPAPGWT